MARKTSGVRSDFLPEGEQKCVLLCPDYCCWASQAQRQPTVTLWHSTNPIADFGKKGSVTNKNDCHYQLSLTPIIH